MKFTRDAAVWNVSFVASVLMFVATQFGLLHQAFQSITITSVGEARIKLAAALIGFIAGYLKMSPLPLSREHPLATNEAGVALSPVNSSKVIAVLVACMLAGGAAFTMPACASVRQVVIQADQSFARAVFAIDDAEWAVYQACRPELACIARHEKLNPQIQKALQDVKAVTAAIKAVPNGVPASLPALLKDLQLLRAAISDIDVVLPGVANATANAETKALALLAQLTGGK